MIPNHNKKCDTYIIEKQHLVEQMVKDAILKIKDQKKPKMNLIWLEACGCSGNIISLLDGEDPDAAYFLGEMVNMTYNNSLMAKEGQEAYDVFMNTLDTDFILVVEGAVATKDAGRYDIVARDGEKLVSGMEAVTLATSRAAYVLAVGTCASYGGPSAARPNPSLSKSVYDYVGEKVVRLPGCPCHPAWVIGTIAHILNFGLPELDEDNRPLLFYSITIHEICPRRSFFDQGIFAERLGEKACLFKLGCRGPITKTLCSEIRWNDRVNWPIGDNTPCIGCARDGFPDKMEPFVRY